MTAVVAALVLPIGAAWLAVRACAVTEVLASRVMAFAASVCIGLGASSLLAFWWAAAFQGLGARFALADAVLWLAVAVVSWGRLRAAPRRPPSGPHPVAASAWLIRGVFVVIAGMAIAAALTAYRAMPDGHPDATLIWNLKARFLIRGGEDWRAFVEVPWSSPSHPLLVSASVARLWAYGGRESSVEPALVGAVVAAGVVAALIGALGASTRRSWLAACVVVAPWTFSGMIAAQTADLPMALYVLVTLIVLLAAWRHATVSMLAAAGVFAGLSAWTKNEGIIVSVLAGLVVVSLAVRERRGTLLAAFIAGAAPAAVTLAWLKLAVAPIPPEYFARGGIAAAGPLLDAARVNLVSSLAWHHWIGWGGDAGVGLLPAVTVAAVVAASRRSGHVARRGLSVAAILCAAYWVVWVLSPLDAAWLVSTTADRLLLHVWPSLVLAAFADPLRGLFAAGNLER